MTEPLLVFSIVFQMREVAPFTTLVISGTSSVDGFGYAPQFVFFPFLHLFYNASPI